LKYCVEYWILDKNDLHINILSILAASQHDDHIMDEYEIAMNLDQTINSIHFQNWNLKNMYIVKMKNILYGELLNKVH